MTSVMMRNQNNAFVTGMLTGAAIGALMVVALSPQVREPVMEGMGAMVGGRMRKMMRRGSEMVGAMMPGDAT
jgi:hypothetical protein